MSNSGHGNHGEAPGNQISGYHPHSGDMGRTGASHQHVADRPEMKHEGASHHEMSEDGPSHHEPTEHGSGHTR
jgi:hypothetical protein